MKLCQSHFSRKALQAPEIQFLFRGKVQGKWTRSYFATESEAMALQRAKRHGQGGTAMGCAARKPMAKRRARRDRRRH